MNTDDQYKELESLKALLVILAKRGYILASELERMRKGCRLHTFTRKDMEQVMRECVAEETQYYDDSASIDRTQDCPDDSECLGEQGAEERYDCLHIFPEASEDAVLAVLEKRKHRDQQRCRKRAAQQDEQEVYDRLLQAREVFSELQLRQSFSITGIDGTEYDRYIDAIVLATFLSKVDAARILDGFLQTLGMRVCRDTTIRLLPEQYDTSLLLLPEDDRNEKTEASEKTISKYRGAEYG